MLTKFISIKNIGRFRKTAGTPNPQLFKHTFISGANGFGKSTLCAVLRSLHTGQPDQLIGRKSLGITEASKVELLFDTGVIRFDGGLWSEAKPSFTSLMASLSQRTFTPVKSLMLPRSAPFTGSL